MGDFYELFLEDAHIGSQILNITLTGKSNGKNEKIPMAGVPYHAVDSYLTKLVKAGYKVAICEQLSPPNKKGLVARDVVRVVTPGTIMDEKSLEKKQNNYIISLTIQENVLAFSVADISTGYLATTELTSDDVIKQLQDELSKLQPSECILPDRLYNDPALLAALKRQQQMTIFPFASWERYTDDATTMVEHHFGVKTLACFGIETMQVAHQTTAALLGYLQETQKGMLSHIKKMVRLSSHDALVLDTSTIVNLELFTTIRDHDTKSSLLSIMDNTLTAMGGRMLKQWMKAPLTDKDAIYQRLEAIDILLQNHSLRNDLQTLLHKIPDIERLLSRLALNLGNGRDLIHLKHALQTVLDIKKQIQQTNHHTSSLLAELSESISTDLQNGIDLIASVIVEEPPLSIKDGGIIQEGIHATLDNQRKTINKSKDWILELERTEREKTGISSLKVRYNKVFGFYIEISKANLPNVPSSYIRKQTLVNGERFITNELKEHEEIILSAEETTKELEYVIFCETLVKVLTYTTAIQEAAQSIAMIDCLQSNATLAEKRRYIRPEITTDGSLVITGGRHPVVEQLLKHGEFVPNDISLTQEDPELLLITGPNMAGKSVYIRQIALLVLMSHMGSFIPADNARISVVDRIFVRSGASDAITSGLSTFMVEMVETAHILQNATSSSLIVMDEIGRGTSTYDGISIAWAVAEYLVTHLARAPKTLFATHYHELQALEKEYPNAIANYHMAVSNDNGQPIFLHSLQQGGASHSFGVAVAKLAGVPEQVIEKAQEILHDLENRTSNDQKTTFENDNMNNLLNTKYPSASLRAGKIPNTDKIIDHILQKELLSIDIATMTPLDALNKLAEIKEKIALFNQSQEDFHQVD